MFQLYKKRNFSDYVSDTFLFFQKNGKHFFKLYFTINGALLLIAAVLIYFVFKVYFEFMFSSLSTGIVQESNSMGAMLQNNSTTIIGVAIFGVLFLMFVSVLQFAFPVIYLGLLDKNKGENFGVKEIISSLKNNALKLFKFIIGSIFILFPILMIIVIVNVLLCFIIIGFPLFIITIPAIMAWMHLIFFHYILGEERFFSAISSAFSDLKQQFWHIILSTLVMYVIVQIVMTIISMIPYIFGVATIFTHPRGTYNQTEGLGILAIMMTAVMIVSIIVNYILNNLILVNQGLVYFSMKEQNESVSSNNSIDLIGTDRE